MVCPSGKGALHVKRLEEGGSVPVLELIISKLERRTIVEQDGVSFVTGCD